MLSTVLGYGDTVVEKIHKNPCDYGACALPGETDNSQ